jgi:hypothetical protein
MTGIMHLSLSVLACMQILNNAYKIQCKRFSLCQAFDANYNPQTDIFISLLLMLSLGL